MHPQRWQQIKETFAQVVDRPADERRAVLDALCGDDAELKREVGSLLDAHDDETDHLISPDAFGMRARLGAVGAVFDYAGRTFGPYRIIREIGRGGMGAVFLAERADGQFEQRVALKVVRRSLADPEIERRFRRERQILATLAHPNIAHLLDGGVSADGEPYFVMEHVEGQRIDEYCILQRLATRDRLKLFLVVCRAVAYAHERLVVHRDLKPSNILVTPGGVPKLLDFGIAKLVDYGERDDHTATEFRVFTPDYASPEQVRGEQPLTPASDVYSLGVLLEVLLEVSGRARDDSAARRGSGSEPGAAAGSGGSGNRLRRDTTRGAGLNRELRNIIAMAKRDEAERRYQSARELSLDIERHLDGLPVVAQPDTVRYRAAKFFERQRAIVAAVVLVVGALAAGFSIARSVGRTDGAAVAVGGEVPASSNPLAATRTIAVLPLKTLRADRARASSTPEDDADRALRLGMADAIVTRMGRVRSLTVRPTSATVRYLDQDYDAAAVGRALHVDSVLEGTLHRVGDELRTNLQLVDVASGNVVWADSVTSTMANVLRGQESLANRVSQLLAFTVSDDATSAGQLSQGTDNGAAQEAFLRGTLALATSVRQVANIFAARDAFEQAIRLDPEFAAAHAGLANAYTMAGSLTLLSPPDAYPKAERAARRALELDPRVPVAYIALAEIEADYNWNWAAAEANNQRALELAPNSAPAHQSYAELLARLGRFSEAASHADLALQIDPTRVNYMAVRALHLYLEHRFADAVAQARRTIAQDATTYLAYLYIAVSQAALGDTTQGLEAATQATALTGGAVPDLFVTAVNHAVRDDHVATQRLIDRLLVMSRDRYVDPFHFVAIYAYLGDRERAFEWLERSFRERSYWMSTIKVHPCVDSLRGDPRFDAMMRRMKLE